MSKKNESTFGYTVSLDDQGAPKLTTEPTDTTEQLEIAHREFNKILKVYYKSQEPKQQESKKLQTDRDAALRKAHNKATAKSSTADIHRALIEVANSQIKTRPLIRYDVDTECMIWEGKNGEEVHQKRTNTLAQIGRFIKNKTA